MRILKKIFLIIFALIGILFLSVWIYLINTRPDYEGTIELKGLHEKVEVVFDEYGIPHIYGENEEDVFHALGYVHAQERLFQMELMRRVGSGRLAEVMGPEMEDVDKFFRTIGVAKISESSAFIHLSADTLPFQKAALAYINGINSFIENGTTPIEFHLIGIPKEKFTVNDIYYIGGYMSFSFSEVFRTDPIISLINKKLGAEYLKDLALEYPGTERKPYCNKISQPQSEIIASVHKVFDKLPIPIWTGSNAWVVAADRSKSGKVLFANDTHIGYSQPAVWYEAHLDYPGFSFYGNFLAGFPFALVGHNRFSSWGLTMLENDDFDLFYEKINPENPHQYLFKEQWLDMEVRTEKIKIKGGKEIEFEVRETHHGPIISDASADLKELYPNEAISAWWVFNQSPSQTLEALYMMAHCNNINTARKAASMIDAPGLNIMYGDADNNIAWWGAAKLVKRPAHVNPLFILDGSSGNDEYLGYYDFSSNPQAENPECGFVYSANNQPHAIDTALYPGYYAPHDRALRITGFLKDDRKFDLEDLKNLHMDAVSVVHSSNAGVIASVLESNTVVQKSALHTEIFSMLNKWDGNHSPECNTPVVYYKLLSWITKLAMEDELEEKNFNTFVNTHFMKNSLPALLNNPNSIWWNNIHTDAIETREVIFEEAFDYTVRELSLQLGSAPKLWKWSEVHTLEHQHPIGKIKPLDKVFNVGVFGVPGGNETVNNSGFKLNVGGIYPVTYGPAMRILIDFADIENSLSILPTGQSGNFMSPHYADQAEMYNSGIFRKQMMNREEINSKAKSRLKLEP
jgi:penicillin G amidase